MFAYRTAFFAASIAFAFLVGSPVHAQITTSVSGIELSSSSQSPVPGQNVTITARSFSGDINAATVTWTVDGKIAQRGTGLTTLTVRAPEIGKKTSVVVTAVMSDGHSLQKSLNISSASIDMIIETDGYTSPFFLGKLAPMFQGKVKFVAIPHLANSAGTEYDPKSLLYTWKKNEKVLEGQSGYGKQSLVLEGDLVPRDYSVSVDVKSRDGVAKGVGTAFVTVTSPTVAFYFDDPLYGPFFNKVIKNSLRIGTEKEVRILSVPLGFSKSSIDNGDLTYTWIMNGAARPELEKNKSIVLRAPADSGGTASITLDIKQENRILQKAKNGFSIEFSAPSAATHDSITF